MQSKSSKRSAQRSSSINEVHSLSECLAGVAIEAVAPMELTLARDAGATTIPAGLTDDKAMPIPSAASVFDEIPSVEHRVLHSALERSALALKSLSFRGEV
jgi:hypothetical protein